MTDIYSQARDASNMIIATARDIVEFNRQMYANEGDPKLASHRKVSTMSEIEGLKSLAIHYTTAAKCDHKNADLELMWRDVGRELHKIWRSVLNWH